VWKKSGNVFLVFFNICQGQKKYHSWRITLLWCVCFYFERSVSVSFWCFMVLYCVCFYFERVSQCVPFWCFMQSHVLCCVCFYFVLLFWKGQCAVLMFYFVCAFILKGSVSVPLWCSRDQSGCGYFRESRLLREIKYMKSVNVISFVWLTDVFYVQFDLTAWFCNASAIILSANGCWGDIQIKWYGQF